MADDPNQPQDPEDELTISYLLAVPRLEGITEMSLALSPVGF